MCLSADNNIPYKGGQNMAVFISVISQTILFMYYILPIKKRSRLPTEGVFLCTVLLSASFVRVVIVWCDERCRRRRNVAASAVMNIYFAVRVWNLDIMFLERVP